MRLSLVVAVAENGVIGKDGGLPWRLPDDLRHFRRRTIDGAVVMGRRTFESLPAPLVRRRAIVVSRTPGYHAGGAAVVPSLDAAIALAEAEGYAELAVIGGAALYEAALPRADALSVTHVDARVEGDTYLPPIEWARWRPVSSEAHEADERHAHPFRIVEYTRAQ